MKGHAFKGGPPKAQLSRTDQITDTVAIVCVAVVCVQLGYDSAIKLCQPAPAPSDPLCCPGVPLKLPPQGIPAPRSLPSADLALRMGNTCMEPSAHTLRMGNAHTAPSTHALAIARLVCAERMVAHANREPLGLENFSLLGTAPTRRLVQSQNIGWSTTLLMASLCFGWSAIILETKSKASTLAISWRRFAFPARMLFCWSSPAARRHCPLGYQKWKQVQIETGCCGRDRT